MNPSNEVATDFDKVAAAAKTAMQSVLDTARRTGTKIIVMRDGKIVHLSPDQLPEMSLTSQSISESK